MHLRKALLEAGDKIEKVLERQVGMQAADNVKLGHSFAVSGCCSLKGLFEGHGIRTGRVLLAPEGAQTTGRNADVGGIDVAIDIEVSAIAVHPFTAVICEPAESQDIGSSVESERVFRAQSLLREHLLVDGSESRVVGLKAVACGHHLR